MLRNSIARSRLRLGNKDCSHRVTGLRYHSGMRIPIITIVASVACAFVLAACGSSSSSSSSTARSASANSNYSKSLAYASCVRSHGVPNFPDPKAGGNGGTQIQATRGHMSVNGVPVNAPAFQAAQQACHSLLPNGGQPPPLDASRKRAMLQFAQCMRSHGVPNFPDPSFRSGTAGFLVHQGSGIDPQSPSFKSAQSACGSIRAKAMPDAPAPPP